MPIHTNLYTNFIQAGTGQPVVLVHGYGGSNRQWQGLIPELTSAGYQVFAPDLVGHGLSDKCPVSVYHIDAVSRYFAAWMDSLNLSRPPILIGHSMGAYVSLSYALRAGKSIGGLFFASPFFTQGQLTSGVQLSLRRPRVSKTMLRMVPEWTIRSALRLTQTKSDRLPRRVRSQIAEDYKRLDPETINAPRTVRDLFPQLCKIQAPTMVVWGENDLTLQPHIFPELCAAMPHARSRMLPGGHLPHLTQPDMFNHTVLDFLARISPPHTASDGRKYSTASN